MKNFLVAIGAFALLLFAVNQTTAKPDVVKTETTYNLASNITVPAFEAVDFTPLSFENAAVVTPGQAYVYSYDYYFEDPAAVDIPLQEPNRINSAKANTDKDIHSSKNIRSNQAQSYEKGQKPVLRM